MAHKLALCEQMCQLYDMNNEDEMRRFEKIEKPIDLSSSANATACPCANSKECSTQGQNPSQRSLGFTYKARHVS